MRGVCIISDPADPRLEPYRAVRERDLVGRQGKFIAEGVVVVRQLLRHPLYNAESVLLAERHLGLAEDFEHLAPNVPIYLAPQSVFDAIAGFPVHRGVLAIGRRGESQSPVALIGSIPRDQPALLAIGIGIANHDNLGAILRNSAAFGCDAALFDQTCGDPLYRKSIRVSAGAALSLAHARGDDAQAILDALQAVDFAVWALSPTGKARLDDLAAPPRLAILVGAEGQGLDPKLLSQTQSVRISMRPGFDSINVATALAIALAAASRKSGCVE